MFCITLIRQQNLKKANAALSAGTGTNFRMAGRASAASLAAGRSEDPFNFGQTCLANGAPLRQEFFIRIIEHGLRLFNALIPEIFLYLLVTGLKSNTAQGGNISASQSIVILVQKLKALSISSSFSKGTMVFHLILC